MTTVCWSSSSGGGRHHGHPGASPRMRGEASTSRRAAASSSLHHRQTSRWPARSAHHSRLSLPAAPRRPSTGRGSRSRGAGQPQSTFGWVQNDMAPADLTAQTMAAVTESTVTAILRRQQEQDRAFIATQLQAKVSAHPPDDLACVALVAIHVSIPFIAALQCAQCSVVQPVSFWPLFAEPCLSLCRHQVDTEFSDSVSRAVASERAGLAHSVAQEVEREVRMPSPSQPISRNRWWHMRQCTENRGWRNTEVGAVSGG